MNHLPPLWYLSLGLAGLLAIHALRDGAPRADVHSAILALVAVIIAALALWTTPR